MKSRAQILIAEDSPTQAAQLAHLLEEHGYEVATAANGREALTLLDRHKPALIITDVLMPELDGYGLCKAIKSDPRWNDLPVMLVTTLSTPLDVIRGLECGADNFIRKPYGETHLLSQIEYMLMNLELRKNQKMQMGVEINLGGQRHFISAERQQILDLLISTYEQAVHINEELKQREKELARSNQVLNGLYRMAAGLNRAGSEREVAELALERALELPAVQAAWISLREGESGFRLAAARNLPPALEVPGAMEGECACRRRLLSGELDSAINILECERLQKATGEAGGLLYHASVPLWIGDRTVGVMNLVGPDRGLFNEDELHVLYGVGNQVAIALERARLHEHLEKLVEERTAHLEAEIGERKRIEQEQARLVAIIEATPDFVATSEPDGHVLYCNQAGLRMLGYEPNHDTSALHIAALHSEWAARLVLETGIPHAVEHGSWSAEAALLQTDGREIPVSQVIVAHRGPDGSVEYLSIIARDISKRREAERNLSESEERYRVMFDGNPHPIWVFDKETLAFLAVNEAAIRRYGYSREEFLSMSIKDIRPPQEVPELLRSIRERAESHTARFFGMFKHRKKDGSVIDVEISSSSITFSGREASLVLAMDVTEKRRLEEEHRQTERQLAQVQRVSSLGRVAATIAHEFNNVLMGIQPFAEVIRRSTDADSKIQNAAGQIITSVARGKRVTQEILRFTQPSEPAVQAVDLTEWVQQLLPELRGLTGDRIEIHVAAPADRVMARCDPAQFQQVVTNLVLNARDAMPDGGTISIAIAGEGGAFPFGEIPEGMVLLSVRDTGSGMPREVLDKIFEPLFTTKRTGTGLGLAVAQQVITRQGGSIHVESAPGEGTTFFLLLPSAKEEGRNATEPPQPKRRRVQRVLVVEDQPEVAEGIASLLEGEGIEVQRVTHGREAAGAVRSFHPDAVLLDVGLPDMSGVDVYAELKVSWPKLPVLFSTGHGDEAALARQVDSPTVGFLRKPYDLATLLEQLEKVIAGDRSGADAAR